jgi:hypothetical protein
MVETMIVDLALLSEKLSTKHPSFSFLGRLIEMLIVQFPYTSVIESTCSVQSSRDPSPD